MCTFFVYILPIIIVLAEVIFMRTCLTFGQDDAGKDIGLPRIVCVGVVAFSFVPILGLIACLTIPFVIGIVMSEYDCELRDNRFNRFWFK